MMEVSKKDYLAPGHRACPGCGAAIAAKLILRALGENTIVVSATGCLETFTATYEQSAWDVPWIHSLFENAAAVASGVEAALEMQGRQANIVVISGDGGTFDIGLGAVSGMFERGNNILYICYDNEAYMNTGAQRSGATSYLSSTTTTPVGTASLGKQELKKDMPAIAVAHGLPYVATASIAYPQDLMAKVKKANAIHGPKYIQVHVPCCVGWGFDPSETVKVAKLAVDTGAAVLYEVENGKYTRMHKVSRKKDAVEYLKAQNRFRHLCDDDKAAAVEQVQKLCDTNLSHCANVLEGS